VRTCSITFRLDLAAVPHTFLPSSAVLLGKPCFHPEPPNQDPTFTSRRVVVIPRTSPSLSTCPSIASAHTSPLLCPHNNSIIRGGPLNTQTSTAIKRPRIPDTYLRGNKNNDIMPCGIGGSKTTKRKLVLLYVQHLLHWPGGTRRAQFPSMSYGEATEGMGWIDR